jgi:TRAP-type C4-dicarboxylate transport system permease small subunit
VEVIDLKLILKNLIEILAGICICSMCASVVVAVVDRFIIGYGLPWPEELARFLLIWSAFLSAASVTRRGQHYVVDFFTEKWVPSQHTRHLRIFMNVVCCGALAVIIKKGMELVQIMHDQISPALRIPMSWVYIAVPICATLMFVFYIMQSIEYLRKDNIT